MGLRAAACHSRSTRSTSARQKDRQARERAALRRYRCERCGQLALVCGRCERNQIYCNRGCARLSRRESLRWAGARHQRTAIGRRNHADRQARYRRRQNQKVTHHTPQQTGTPTTPGLSGPTSLAGFPDKEDSDVCSRPVPVLSLAVLRSVAPQVADAATAPPQASSSRRASQVVAQEHTCHFCQRTRSRELRRDFLVDLSRRSRRPRGRRKRSSP